MRQVDLRKAGHREPREDCRLRSDGVEVVVEEQELLLAELDGALLDRRPQQQLVRREHGECSEPAWQSSRLVRGGQIELFPSPTLDSTSPKSSPPCHSAFSSPASCASDSALPLFSSCPSGSALPLVSPRGRTKMSRAVKPQSAAISRKK